MQNVESVSTLATLANATELVLAVMFDVVGNEIADSFNGSELTRGTIAQIAQTRFKQQIAAKQREG